MIGDQPVTGYGGYKSGRGLSPTSLGRSPLSQGLQDYSPSAYFGGNIFKEVDRIKRFGLPGSRYIDPNTTISSSQGKVDNIIGGINTAGAAGPVNFAKMASVRKNPDKITNTDFSFDMKNVIDDMVNYQIVTGDTLNKEQQQAKVARAVDRGVITKTEADKFFGTVNGIFPNQADFKVVYNDDGKLIGYSELLAKNLPNSRNNITFSKDGKGDVSIVSAAGFNYGQSPSFVNQNQTQSLLSGGGGGVSAASGLIPMSNVLGSFEEVGTPVESVNAAPGGTGMGGSIDIGPFQGVYDGQGVASLRSLLGPNTEAGLSFDLNSKNLGLLGSTRNLFNIPGFEAAGTVNQEGDYTYDLGFGPFSLDGSNSQSVLGYNNPRYGIDATINQDGDVTGNFSINDLLGIKGFGAQLNYDSNTGPSGMIGYSGRFGTGLDPEAVIDLENPNQQLVAGTGLNPNSYFYSSPVSEQLSGKNFSTNSDAISNIRFEDVQKEYAQRMKDSKAQEQVAQAAAQAVQAIQSIPQSQPSLSSSDQAALANQISNNFINTEILRKERTPITEMNAIQIAAAGQQNQEALNRLPKYAREAIRAGKNPMGGSKDIIQDMIIDVLKPVKPWVKAEGER
tara:strand:- start:6393 stop:8249 length:1857 start_codon:yes stop_codon:yes gene_type:complete